MTRYIICDIDEGVVLSANGKDLVTADKDHSPKMFKQQDVAEAILSRMRLKSNGLRDLTIKTVEIIGYPLI